MRRLKGCPPGTSGRGRPHRRLRDHCLQCGSALFPQPPCPKSRGAGLPVTEEGQDLWVGTGEGRGQGWPPLLLGPRDGNPPSLRASSSLYTVQMPTLACRTLEGIQEPGAGPGCLSVTFPSTWGR